MTIRAYSKDSKPDKPGHIIHLVRDSKTKIGELVEIVDAHGGVVNVAQVIDNKSNPPTFYQKWSAVCKVLA